MALSDKEIAEISERLRELGIWQTSANDFKVAVRAFQRINNLKVDGVVGPKTKAALWPTSAGLPIDRDDMRIATPAPVTHPSSKWPTQANCEPFYGAVGSNQTMATLPFPMRIAWSKSQTVNKFSCHMKVREPIEHIFSEVMKAYDKVSRTDLGLDLYGGCLNVRKMRGGSAWSMHAWGIAVDIDPVRNDLHSTRKASYTGSDGKFHMHAKMSDPEYVPYWQIIEATGAVSLGRDVDFDWMHYQFARL